MKSYTELAEEIIGNISHATLLSICRDFGIEIDGDHIDLGEIAEKATIIMAIVLKDGYYAP
jgi:hypothetical protein